jgi:rhodanese-related sulfurtransferase
MQWSVQEVAERLKDGKPPKLLDIREPAEYDIVHLPNAILATQEVVNELLESGDRGEEIVCICHHGVRSLNAANFLRQQGFTQVRSMKGGLDAWSLQIDPKLPRY